MFVRSLTDAACTALHAGLRSGDLFTARRCQMLLASAGAAHPPAIATPVGCHGQTVRTVLHAFNRAGLASLTRRSSRPQTIHAAFAAAAAEQVRELRHRRPRDVGKPPSVWTVALAAEVSFSEGRTATRVSDETVRTTLVRLGLGWRRAQPWITSRSSRGTSDHTLARPAAAAGRQASPLGAGRRGCGLVESAGAAPPARLGRRRGGAAAGGADGRPRRSGPASAGLLRPAGARSARGGGGRLAARCQRPAGQRPHDAVPGLVRCATGGRGPHGLAAGLGPRRLAAAPCGPPLAARAQPPGQAARRGRAHPRLPLPSKSLWLNPIEPHGVHAKRASVEPTRLRSAQELADRVGASFACPHHEHLIMAEQVV